MSKRLRQSRFAKLVMRHRMSLQDLSLVAITALAAAYYLYAFDIFIPKDGTAIQHAIELDEMFVLAAILTSGLLVFSARLLRRQKHETRRRMDAEHQLRTLAFQDPLTGLPNRRSFNDALKIAIASPPGSDAMHGLFMLDLNGFKQLNDVYGHGAGDEALVVVAQRLISVARGSDLVARLGGDEFVILARHLPSAEAATSIAQRVMDSMHAPISIGGVQHRLSTGIGICLFPFAGQTIEEIIRRADVAMYRAKSDRKSSTHFFDQEMDQKVREREELERALREALEAREIQPYFQPVVDLKTGNVTGFEVLARWSHPTLGSIPPSRFIAVAEDIGVIGELSGQLLHVACETAMTWPPHVRLCFNVSPADLKERTLALRVLSILNKTGFPASRLELEITESALVEDTDTVREVLGGLRDIGVRVALDDFGTGYSNLYHLRALKIDTLKIDRSFVQSMRTERESAEIVRALLGLGQGLGLKVIAEGVEERVQGADLLAQGCQEGQGYLFSKAVTADETKEFFADVGRHAAS